METQDEIKKTQIETLLDELKLSIAEKQELEFELEWGEEEGTLSEEINIELKSFEVDAQVIANGNSWTVQRGNYMSAEETEYQINDPEFEELTVWTKDGDKVSLSIEESQQIEKLLHHLIEIK